MKLTIVGGGSTYTPELLNGVLDRAEALGLTEVAIVDPRADRREPVAAFSTRLAARIAAEQGRTPVRITATDDLDAALPGSDFVVLQIRVGGQEGRHADIRMGTDLGLIGQETTGVGGLAKALRTIPVIMGIAERIKALAPDAWILNFTNPSGMVTEALYRKGFTRTVGLCNVPIEMKMDIAKVLGRDEADVHLDWVGLNHLGWVRRVMVDGEDVLPPIIDEIESGVPGPANLPEIAYPDGYLAALGMLPSSYVRFFTMGPEMHAEIMAKKKTRAEEVMEIEVKLLELYNDPTVDTLPELLSQRGGAWYSRLAVNVIAALQSETPTTHIVNTTHQGAIPGLPEGAVAELPCSLSKSGIVPTPLRPMEPEIGGLVHQVKAYETLGVDAALSGRRDQAFLALCAHPLVPDVATAAKVLDALTERGIVRPAPPRAGAPS